LLISNYTAKRLKIKTGDSFIVNFVQDPPRPRKFVVAGIYDIGIDEIDRGFAIGNLDIIRRINNWDNNEIGGIEVRVRDFKRLKPTADEIYQQLNADLQSESVLEYFPSIFIWLDLLDVNTKVLLILMLIVGVINMITALLIMILERTNMIGMLKSFGATNLSIMKIFLYNALYLIGIGLLLGNLLGLGLAFLQQETHIFKLTEASYYLKFVPVEIHFMDVLALNLATIVICLFVLVLPSMLVMRVSPLKAIRFK
ncbi:MAG: ABC transporter permease, partial [Pedobacter sp.]